MWSFPDMAALDAQLDEAKIAIGEIRSLEEIAASEWAEYWGATLEVPDRNGGTFKLPGRPWKFSGGELSIPGAPSIQGENNHEVLKGLGYDDGAIKKMEDSGVVVGNFAAHDDRQCHGAGWRGCCHPPLMRNNTMTDSPTREAQTPELTLQALNGSLQAESCAQRG